jgi:hypothetical protein
MSAMTRWIVGSAAAVVLAAGALNAVRAADVSHDPLMHMIQSARTRADHEEIASIYEQQARADRTSADEHRKMEKLYRAFGQADPAWAESGQTPVHCQNLTSIYQSAAEEHEALAELHRQAARDAR